MIDKKFKAVFWDFGGVITSSPFQAFSSFEKENNLPKDFIRRVNSTNPYENAWAKLESSKISLEEFDKLFALESENLGFKIKGSKILELLQGSVVPEMVKMLELLKEESFLLACLTNNFNANEDKSALDNNNQEKQRILGLFDYIIESREVGVRKPEDKFYEKAESFNLYPTVDEKYYTYQELEDKTKDLQTDKDGNLIILYAQNKDAQYTYIESAKEKGYEVLLLDSPIIPHLIQKLESKKDKLKFSRVDFSFTISEPNKLSKLSCVRFAKSFTELSPHPISLLKAYKCSPSPFEASIFS